MSFLSDLTSILSEINIPVKASMFFDTAPNEYVVVAPLTDDRSLYGDAQYAEQEACLSVYAKSGNYLDFRKMVLQALLGADIIITNRRYVGQEESTGYHHYAIDVMRDSKKATSLSSL
jgi:hypothetical protein